ncbi:hypothetical protein GCM10010124_37160 [Pilimelia terevasa]|uniref:Secreted protein n=1 Tax=Pilimelia terevasa TaxID=53372 RepID=A0A8J3BUS0_9ACTN|nr:DUF4360 domain-containing protein [Pilimelia terevasa]GGK40890.1 hypothetical protein GCM10010124_37160 [Pilimelia terevasa]
MTLKMFISSAGVAAVVAGTALAGAPAMATAEDPANVPISAKLEAANGTGCKVNDGKEVTVTSFPTGVVQINLPRMQAKAGGKNGARANVNCQANLAITVPAGYTWSLDAIGVKGFAYLGEGTTGMALVTSYISGMTETGEVSTNLEGKYNGRWVQLDAPDKAIQAPCGEDRKLNVNTRVQANAGKDPKNSSAIMTLRSNSAEDHDVLLSLNAVKCPA